MKAPLAIVIPAYKARFLDEALASIAAQTRREFRVYVGDDASPEGLEAVCRRWQKPLGLRYTRFESNLGGRDLVAQWQRCVALSNEPWVWLFSDDDRMPPDAVERLLAAFKTGGELFHFDVEQIDAEGRVLRREPDFPRQLPVREFARRRLRFELSSFAPDYVFARAAYERVGGFVNFPRAWCSDDASWIAFGAAHGIRTLAGAPVQWRFSGANISARHGPDAVDKLRAQVAYLRWLDAFLRANPAREGEPDDRAVTGEARRWFFRQCRFLDLRFDRALVAETVRGLEGVRGFDRAAVAAGIWRFELRQMWRAFRRKARSR